MGDFMLGRRPGLDGLRGVAVLAVVGFHYGSGRLPFRGGAFGVDIFFVLSGFLITTILCEEHARSGRISLTRFYRRRAARLLPALGLFLAFIVAVTLATYEHPGRALVEAGAAAAYCANWLYAIPLMRTEPIPPTLHTWSLAVEEQFYFVWPLLLILLLRRSSRLVAGVAVLLACVSAAEHLTLTGDARVDYGTDTRMAGLMIGCALAAALKSGLPHRRLPRTVLIPAAIFVALCVAVLNLDSAAGRGLWIVFDVAAAVVVWDVVTAESCLVRFLANRPLMWVGRISYGVYLWHWGLVVVLAQHLPWHDAALLGVPATFACSAASFYLVEQPILNRRRRRPQPILVEQPA